MEPVAISPLPKLSLFLKYQGPARQGLLWEGLDCCNRLWPQYSLWGNLNSLAHSKYLNSLKTTGIHREKVNISTEPELINKQGNERRGQEEAQENRKAQCQTWQEAAAGSFISECEWLRSHIHFPPTLSPSLGPSEVHLVFCSTRSTSTNSSVFSLAYH